MHIATEAVLSPSDEIAFVLTMREWPWEQNSTSLAAEKKH